MDGAVMGAACTCNIDSSGASSAQVRACPVHGDALSDEEVESLTEQSQVVAPVFAAAAYEANQAVDVLRRISEHCKRGEIPPKADRDFLRRQTNNLLRVLLAARSTS